MLIKVCSVVRAEIHQQIITWTNVLHGIAFYWPPWKGYSPNQSQVGNSNKQISLSLFPITHTHALSLSLHRIDTLNGFGDQSVPLSTPSSSLSLSHTHTHIHTHTHTHTLYPDLSTSLPLTHWYFKWVQWVSNVCNTFCQTLCFDQYLLTSDSLTSNFLGIDEKRLYYV